MYFLYNRYTTGYTLTDPLHDSNVYTSGTVDSTTWNNLSISTGGILFHKVAASDITYISGAPITTKSLMVDGTYNVALVATSSFTLSISQDFSCRGIYRFNNYINLKNFKKGVKFVHTKNEKTQKLDNGREITTIYGEPSTTVTGSLQSYGSNNVTPLLNVLYSKQYEEEPKGLVLTDIGITDNTFNMPCYMEGTKVNATLNNNILVEIPVSFKEVM